MKVKRFHKFVLIGFAAVISISIQCGVAFSAPEKATEVQKKPSFTEKMSDVLFKNVAIAAEEKTDEAKKEPSFTEKMSAILFQEKEDAFVYKREARNDPFVPFVRERVVSTETPVEELTGMRKFEPGQLAVVAIVMSPLDRFAMVQDSNNQGYIIREGILLGRTGIVEAIVPNKVIVKNYTYNLAGDKIYKTVEMVLKQEGEK